MPDTTGATAASDSSTLAAASSPSDFCLVQTSIGAVEGFIDPPFPHVRQWLGIPFAEPPVGHLRFAPPVPKAALPKEGVFSANKMPLAPMQAITTKPDVYAKHVPEFLATGPYSEDCLYLNIFAPVEKPAPNEKLREPLPTIVFFYGGEGEWGGINAEYSQPQQWVENSQNHIVVLLNYRVGIFGFPNAKGLKDGPLGILDQRMALEFLRANITSFGGCPSKLVAYGHAAGSGSIEAHLFAWPDDPIISAAICISGFLTMGGTTRDMAKESFSLLARRLGCPENASPEEEVEFVRGVDAGAILGCFRAYNDSGVDPRMFFRPQCDGRILLSPEEQLERAYKGKFAKIPMLLGMTAEDGNALVPCREMEAGKDAAALQWTSRIEGVLQQTIDYRLANNCTTYRCLYAGDFVNVSPKPWMRAYHFSELPMIMGTHSSERSRSTDFQKQLSTTMQEMWVAFARDPEKGLANWGWEAARLDFYHAMVLGRHNVLFQQIGSKALWNIASFAGIDGGFGLADDFMRSLRSMFSPVKACF